MKRIAVLGSVAIDTICTAHHVPTGGERVFGECLGAHYGGMAANQAVAVASVGAEAYLLGKVGKDQESDEYVRYLESRKVNTTCLLRSEHENLGRTYMFLTSDGDYFSIVAAGANEKLTYNEIEQSLAALGECDCLMVQLEMDTDVIEYALSLARKRSILTVLTISPPERARDGILELADIVISNLREARMVLGIKDPSHNELTAKLAGKKKIYVVTLGSEGSAALKDGVSAREASISVKEVDSVGAGDAFAGVFVGTFLQSGDIHKALRWGNIAGALATTMKGAQSYRVTATDLSAHEQLILAGPGN